MREKTGYKCAASKQKEKMTGDLYRTCLVYMGNRSTLPQQNPYRAVRWENDIPRVWYSRSNF